MNETHAEQGAEERWFASERSRFVSNGRGKMYELRDHSQAAEVAALLNATPPQDGQAVSPTPAISPDSEFDTVIIAVELICTACGVEHLDEGEWETRPHRTHLCLVCGHLWRVTVRGAFVPATPTPAPPATEGETWVKEQVSGIWRVYHNWSIREDNEVCKAASEADADQIIADHVQAQTIADLEGRLHDSVMTADRQVMDEIRRTKAAEAEAATLRAALERIANATVTSMFTGELVGNSETFQDWARAALTPTPEAHD
eukprot:GHVR01182998.1.p1 GENE.GHVR01182998.1~~GHVR01182998.1.p1  ORF type:complete len:259 (-),score=39.62 GHVR01182998.1:376-1152(-)